MLPSLFEFKPDQFGLPPFDDLIDGQVSLWVHAMRCSMAACCAVILFSTAFSSSSAHLQKELRSHPVLRLQV